MKILENVKKKSDESESQKKNRGQEAISEKMMAGVSETMNSSDSRKHNKF